MSANNQPTEKPEFLFTAMDFIAMQRVFSQARKALHDDVKELETIIALEKSMTSKMLRAVSREKEPEKKANG